MTFILKFSKDSTRLLRTDKHLTKLQNTKLTYKNKTVSFLYICDKHAEKEVWKDVPFTVVSINKKCIRINITSEIKDLYLNNFKDPELKNEKDLPY